MCLHWHLEAKCCNRPSHYLMKEYPFSGKTRISSIWPNGEKVCRIRCSEILRRKVFLCLLSNQPWTAAGWHHWSTGHLPDSPDWIPPQYTVQFCGLDWITTSSNLRCFEPSEIKANQRRTYIGPLTTLRYVIIWSVSPCGPAHPRWCSHFSRCNWTSTILGIIWDQQTPRANDNMV